ncbi:MAG: hypothetical protein RR537_07115, partial [Longicatena sp.]
LRQKFDLVVSSLAIHYIQDYDKLIEDVSSLLNDNGIFIFSLEHPLSTAPKNDDRWTKDETGNVKHYNLSSYGIQGKRETQWIVKGVIKYHRTFSTLLNTLITKGFMIEAVEEPLPDENLVKKFPQFKKSYDKPDFLFIKSKKQILKNRGKNMEKIITNKIRCKLCGDIIESKYTHDNKACSCKAVGADGGLEYLKRTGNSEDYEELSEILKDGKIRMFETPK